MDYSETDAKSRGNEETTSSVPLSEYAKKLVGDINGISGGEGVHFVSRFWKIQRGGES